MVFLKDFKRSCQTSYDPIQKIWSGIKITPTYGPDSSLGKALLEALLKDPEHICQICHHNGKVYTNQEIADLSIRVAQHLQKLGVHQLDNIGIVAGNTDYTAPLVFGALMCGLVICPVDPSHDAEIIKPFFEKTKPSIIFTVGSEYEKIKQCLDSNALIYTINDHMRGVPEITEFIHETGTEKDFKPEPLQYGYTQIAAILRSSGTTGIPKAVCVDHASLLNTYRGEFDAGTVYLRNSTIYWISGLSRLIGNCLQGLTSLINERGFKSLSVPDVVKEYKVTVMNATIFTLVDILEMPNTHKIDLSSLKQIITGGCCFPYPLVEKAKTLMPNADFALAYGTSEGCGAITAAICNPENHCGQLVPNMDIKIVDDLNRNLGINETGEVCSRSIFPFPGYYKDPELTATVYKDGWIHTGDLGYINEEENLFILERKKEVVKYMGQTIYPNELEKIMFEIPGVLDVCVCGLPNDNVGHLVAALVSKSADSNVTAEEIEEYVAQRVGDQKKLRGGVYFISSIPKTQTGKHLRQRATDICEFQRKNQLKGLKRE